METTDRMNVIHARAAGVDVHKMQLTATVRLARPDAQAKDHHPGVQCVAQWHRSPR